METITGRIQNAQSYLTPETKPKKLLLILGSIVLVFFLWFVKAEYLDKPTLLTVIGEGRVEVVPEVVRFSIKVVNNASSPNVAATDNRRTVEDVRSMLKGAGVSEKDVTISYVRVIPPSANLGLTTYQAVNAIDVTLRDVSKFDNLVSSLYSIGVASVSNIVFTTEDSGEIEKKAINEAIKDAKKKAGDTAKVSRKRVSRIVSIQTTEMGEAGALSGEIAETGFDGQSSASLSKIEITRRATLVFELKSLF